MSNWIRHRFHANSEDYRPITFPPPGPYWCSGYAADHSVIVAYLPEDVSVHDYWPEAEEIDSEPRDEIVFTSRFPKPEWWNQDAVLKEKK